MPFSFKNYTHIQAMPRFKADPIRVGSGPATGVMLFITARQQPRQNGDLKIRPFEPRLRFLRIGFLAANRQLCDG